MTISNVLIVLMTFFVLISSGKGEDCGMDCRGMPDGDYPCNTDCSKFVQCANGYLFIQSCQPGLFYNYKTDQCDWLSNIPDDSPCLHNDETTLKPTTSTTTMKPTTTEEETTTSEPETTTEEETTTSEPETTTEEETTTSEPETTTAKVETTTTFEIPTKPPIDCFPQACNINDDGTINEHEVYPNTADPCHASYFECNLNRTCYFECGHGLFFNNVTLSCELPTEDPDYWCLDEDNQGTMASIKSMRNSHPVLDPSKMNMPECYESISSQCTFSFRPSYGLFSREGDSCVNEYEICYEGWICKMRCDAGFLLDLDDKECKPKRYFIC
eukprot:TRINITY_DN5384_c0_g1_i8.p1 TRINITY_DN5384_c0_g1~~TRINITY_DN5384_c0_g1_i8.p1  ORF type:complete len:337 (-),score=47.42 TRINITY_DN5384_c0_g1_i8:108-1091(-)